MSAKNYWILKTEPETYSWNNLVNEGEAIWDGVRNYAARNFLKEMALYDVAFIYHSGKERTIVGVAEITETAFPDPGDELGKFVAVKVKAVSKLSVPVTLNWLKGQAEMQRSPLIKQSRLSVIPVSKLQAEKILRH
jgi:predicted RNA-binding protein with PUA-like domain